MATERTRQLVLGGLVLVLIVVIVKVWPGTSAAPAPTSNRTGSTSAARQAPGTAAAPTTQAVHLDALNGERPKPEPAERNLFRFKPKAPPPAPPVERPPPITNPVPTGPPPPPPVPPIPLKFIGTVERGGQKIAILSDSSGHVSYGPEGATIDGRYRIIKIGVESVEVAHVDGRGQQLIRKTGS